jgi:hypothetical protein
MSGLPTFEATRNATSSLASASGPTRSGEPGGRTPDQSGPAHARVNLSARQAKEAGLMTSGTYGRRGSISSRSSALQSSLASRLRARTASAGSTLYTLTWKERTTPSGLRICALRASARRTSDSDYSSWPTPAARDFRSDRSQMTDAELYGTKGRPLPRVSYLAGWPTPMAGTPAQNGNNEAGNNDSSRKTVALAGWGTPNASAPGGTPEQALKRKEGLPCGQSVTTLEHQVQLVGPARLTASGEMLTGSSAAMESGGQLSPAHSLWLMLGPIGTVWLSCAERVIRSSRKPQSRSSKPTKKHDVFA